VHHQSKGSRLLSLSTKAPHQAGVQFLGNNLIGHACAPGRIFELSATLLIYVLTVLVWEVLVELKSRQT
jgi:hypothetical protein